MFIPSLPVIRPQHDGLPLPAGCGGKVRNLNEDRRPAVKVGVSFPLCYVFPPSPELLAGGTHVYDATGQGLPLHEGGREGDGGELGVPGIICLVMIS